MRFNFGVIFAVFCIISGILIIACCKPLEWLMKNKGMPNHYKWYLRVPGIMLILLGIFVIIMSSINVIMIK